jgi:hypothetical protein
MKITVTYIGSSTFNVFNPNGKVSYAVPAGNSDAYLCEQAFKIFNAPPDLLDDDEQQIAGRARALRLTSMSVGDTVRIEDASGAREYVCDSAGFTRKESRDVTQIGL